MQLESAGLSDIGRRRDHNEDEFIINSDDGLFAIADGMGGHAAGEVASHIAIQAILDFVHSTRVNSDATWPYDYDTTLSSNGNLLRTAIRLANRRICETIQEQQQYQDMGTTVVGVLVSPDFVATVGHVGDSRAYLVRNGAIRQLTSDHSWVNEQFKLGFLTRDDAIRHPFRNVVTRALGSRQEVMVDLSEERLAPGDRLLLCSDGLNSMLDDDTILAIVSAAGDDVEKACADLVAAANEHGGEDNVTIVVAQARP